MSELLETNIIIFSLLSPVAIMAPAAWLIYHRRAGWGWYLLAATLIAGSIHVKFDGFGKTDCPASEER